MNFSTPTSLQKWASWRGRNEAPRKQWRSKYSVGESERSFVKCLKIGFCALNSSTRSFSTIQPEPASVSTYLRFGCRSKAPDHIIAVKGRCAHMSTSLMYIAVAAGTSP